MYQYKIIDKIISGRSIDFEIYLNELGEDDWELVAVDNGIYIFKRRSFQDVRLTFSKGKNA